MADIILKPAALTAEAFAPFGEVIEIGRRRPRWINGGSCERFDDVAQPDVLAAGGSPKISIFRAAARELPLHVKVLERHPLSSQAFIPLDGLPFLVVVAEAGRRRSAPASVLIAARAPRALTIGAIPGITHCWHWSELRISW